MTDYAQYKLRMPVDLKSRIDRAAFESGRSISAEIIGRLERSFELGKPEDPALRAALEYTQTLKAYEEMKVSFAQTKEALGLPDDWPLFIAMEAEIAFLRDASEKLRKRFHRLSGITGAPDDGEPDVADDGD